MDLRQGVVRFIVDEVSAELLNDSHAGTYFDVHHHHLRHGWVNWFGPLAVTIEFDVDFVSESQLDFIKQMRRSPASKINTYTKKDRVDKFLTWESSWQQLPQSRKGISEVLTPVFLRAERDIAEVLIAMQGPRLATRSGVTPLEQIAQLSNPVGFA